MSQLIGTSLGVCIALAGGAVVYGVLKKTIGIRMGAEEEFDGADLSIHKIVSSADD
jgi:Amt family ammonium transporter